MTALTEAEADRRKKLTTNLIADIRDLTDRFITDANDPAAEQVVEGIVTELDLLDTCVALSEMLDALA